MTSGFRLPQLCTLFLEMLRSERGRTDLTLSAYKQDLRELFTALKGKQPLDVTTDDIRFFLDYLRQKGRSTASVARKISSLRQFYTFLLTEGYLKKNPLQYIQAPRKEQQLPRILTIGEIKTLLNEAAANKKPSGVCFYTCLQLLYATGMRVSELLSLSRRDVVHVVNHSDPQKSRTLRVVGKGGAERVVFLTTEAQESLKAHWGLLPPFSLSTQSLPLFVARGNQKALTRQYLTQTLKTLGSKCGISPERLSPHVLRHAFATHILQQGADLVSVQKLLGHRDLSTTQIYTHLCIQDIQAALLKHHPLAQTPPLKKAQKL